VVSVGLNVALPKLAPWFFSRYGDRVIEPEIKLVFVCLFVHAGSTSALTVADDV
jgi:hypothetical protein